MKLKQNISYSIHLLIVQIIILILFFINSDVFAISLSEAKVYSYLNEPLRAEIEVNDIDNLEASNIIAELANTKYFMSSGIPKEPFLSKLKFSTKKINDKKIIINIFTTQAVKNSFLDFLIKVDWPDGEIIKNCTILLEPKGLKSDDDFRGNTSVTTINTENEKAPLLVNPIDESLSSEALINNYKLPESKSSYGSKDQQNDIKTKVQPNLSTEMESAINSIKGTNSSLNLDKLISSLNTLSEQNNRSKINYEKLFSLKTNDVPINKETEKAMNNLAINQINSELESFRYNSAQNNNGNNQVNSNVNNNSVSSMVNPDNQSIALLPNIRNKITKSYSLDSFTKKANDLLWSCCLVSVIIFLFHKMLMSSRQQLNYADSSIDAKNKMDDLTYSAQNNNDIVHNDANNYNDDYHYGIDHLLKSNILNEIPNIEDLNKKSFISTIESNKINNINNINKKVNNNILTTELTASNDNFINNDINNNQENQQILHTGINNIGNNDNINSKNHEIELKISLAQQYLDVGDKKSARAILQEINIIKESVYYDKVFGLLRSIS